jgi:hypothetical protein
VQEVRPTVPGIYARRGSVGVATRVWFAVLRRDLPQVQADYRMGEAVSKKASQCDQCSHATLKWYVYRGGEPFDVLICDYHHKPRFYKQRHDNPLDDSYGWKRVCADFEMANADVTGAELAKRPR